MRFKQLDESSCRRLNVALALGLWLASAAGAALVIGLWLDFGHLPGLGYRLLTRTGAGVLAAATLGIFLYSGVLIKPGKGTLDP
ncbi:MAG TPA: hypothetical protein DCM05_03720 [Elusimicrobia bacterium]|nr:hypothetical protein [Elusimicrobiota bacterium]